ILRVDIVDAALSNIKCRAVAKAAMARRRQMSNGKTKTVLLDPKGELYSQKKARELSKLNHLILICGHYEGVDERVKSLVDESISIGEYVLTGGELPAMVIVDSIVRLLPGVLKKEEATQNESFSLTSTSTHQRINASRILEYPQYTRPEIYKSVRVPKVLLSGNHRAIATWRKDHTTTVRRDPASRRLRPGSVAETLMPKNPDT
ncbi:hypothetical protein HY411_03000, partial [Candidatus Gottesmanbacteria bacterium]|nr:hypothetical protein [Candidatus Gottesmanbacteria bacterium]